MEVIRFAVYCLITVLIMMPVFAICAASVIEIYFRKKAEYDRTQAEKLKEALKNYIRDLQNSTK